MPQEGGRNVSVNALGNKRKEEKGSAFTRPKEKRRGGAMLLYGSISRGERYCRHGKKASNQALSRKGGKG